MLSPHPSFEDLGACPMPNAAENPQPCPEFPNLSDSGCQIITLHAIHSRIPPPEEEREAAKAEAAALKISRRSGR